MGKMITQLSLAMLVAAGSIVILSKQMASSVDAVDFGHSGAITVADLDGYFVATLGKVPLILGTDFIPG